MANSKYRLTDESKTMDNGAEVYRIEALEEFNNVRVGDLGGFIEKEENLSFEDEDISWVYDDDSVVYGDSEVKWGSIVYKGGVVKDTQMINGSRVSYHAKVEDSFLQGTEVQLSGIKNTKSFDSKINNSRVDDSEVVFSEIGDTNLKNSFVESSNTFRDSVISNSHLEDETLGKARLSGYDSRLQLDDSDIEDLNDIGREINR